MKNWKRSLAMMLALIMVLTFLPLGTLARAAEDEYSGTWGETQTWSFNPDTGTLTLSGSGADFLREENGKITGTRYDIPECPWKNLNWAIKNVVIEDGVLCIGNSAFENCVNLDEISISNSVVIIGRNAFRGCNTLTEVSIPKSVESMDESFAECSHLEKITVEEGNPCYYSDARGCVYEKTKYETRFAFAPGAIEGSYAVAEGTTEILENAFAYCSNLTSVVLPDGLKSIGNSAFKGCMGLMDIEIPHSVQKIENAFYDTGISENEENWEDGVLYVSGCLVGLDHSIIKEKSEIKVREGTWLIPNGALSFLPELKTVVLPDGLEWIGYAAFSGSGITSITVPGSVKKISDEAFVGANNLKEVIVSEGVKEIDYGAFWGDEALTSVILPDSLEILDECAFRGCPSLTNIRLPHGPNILNGITYHMFSSTALYQNEENWEDGVLYVSDYLIDVKKEISGAYQVKEGTLQIAEGAFIDCEDLTEVTIPESVKMIGACAFQGCKTLSDVSIPEGVIKIEHWAFAGCANLHSITVPTSVKEIEPYAFAFSGLKEATILSDDLHVGYYAFLSVKGAECGELQNVYFTGKAPQLDKGKTSFLKWESTDINYDEQEEPVSFIDPELILYYVEGKEGWTTPTWNGYPTDTWDGVHIPGTDPEPTDPAPTDPEPTNPAPTDPQPTDPVPTDPQPTDPVPTDPQPTEPKPTEPKPTEPTPTEPEPTEPKPTEPVENPFVDVRESAYYHEPVQWAVANKVTAGTDATHFSPSDTCTRAQVISFLWRAAGCPEPKSTNNPFQDVSSERYYYKAVLWAVEQGITAGTDASHFSPNEGCTRAQVVTFLWRFAGQPEAKSGKNPFQDVSAGKYYSRAVLWAVEQGVTAGTDASHFSPSDTCTRAQAVTFLWRYLGK